ncbi:MAG TPA: GNAT family N-acetyltransferase [Vicinamibacterales bacterium]
MRELHHLHQRNLPVAELSRASGVGVRPVQPGDEPFLLDLYATTRDRDFALLDDAVRRPLLRLQFTAQQAGYTARFPGAEHNLIAVGGERAGQIRLASSPSEIRVVDISLLPQYRGRGIGTMLYRDVQARAAADGQSVAASVEKSNTGSLQFHRRLGFSVESETERDYRLRSG